MARRLNIARTPLKKLQIRVLVLLCVMYAISYIDRSNISTAAPSITAALHLSTTQLGIIFSAFSIPYALLQVVGGNVGERFGPRKSLIWIGILWGIATIATGWSVGFISLFGARLLLGLSESAAFPVATQAMSRWFPARRNGLVQGVVHSAARLGNALAPLLVALLITLGDWRTSFYAIGVLSIVWAIIWAAFFRNNPIEYPKVAEDTTAKPIASHLIKRPPVPWKRLIRSMLPVAFVDFGYGWMLWVFITWLPTFLSSTYHLTLGKFALYTSLILMAGVVGDTLGGMLSDWIYKRTGDMSKARRYTIIFGLVGSLFCLSPLMFAQTLVVASVSLALSFFFLELTNASLWSIPMEVAPTWAGTASGMMNTGFGLAGIASPIVFGALIGTYGWRLPFGLSIGLLALAAIVAAIMRPKPLERLRTAVV